ncbi:MAG: hypothetical protein GC191_09205 [Azospirillum sp.]|nr:hypothetical protein [Azospirillum sp.]
MIKAIYRIPVGNALRLSLEPPAGAEYWRVLRRTSDSFAGPDDAGAVVVADQSDEAAIIDSDGLANGAAYFYRAYYWVSGAWVASGTNSGTPLSSYSAADIDPLVVLRDRLRLGLADAVARGVLQPHSGEIKVLTAPFASAKDASFPVVSVHLDHDAPSDRFLGELLCADADDGIGGSISGEGWHSQATLNVVGVSLNPDERIALRRAIKAIVIANLDVFESKNMWRVEFTQRDTESFQENNAALYITSGTFTCTFPSYVFDDGAAVSGVEFFMDVE